MEFWQIPFRHNAWATRYLLEQCRPLSDEQFHRTFAIGCGSLHATFLHIIGAMSRWSDRIPGRALRPSPESPGAKRSIDDLLAMLDTAARELEDVVAAILVEKREFEMMEFRDSSGKLLATFRRASAIHHVVSHGMHHRAQILNMLRQLGVSPIPEVDVIDWECSSGEWPAP